MRQTSELDVQSDNDSIHAAENIHPTDSNSYRKLVSASVILWGLVVVAGFYMNQSAFSAGLLHNLKEFTFSLFWLVALLLASFGLGLPFVRRLLPSALDAELFLFGSGVGLGIISLAVLFLGLTGLLWPTVIWVFLGVANLWALYQLWWRKGLQTVARAFSQTIPRQLQILDWFLVFIIFCGFLFSFLAYALVPPLNWDEIAYHLAIPKIYIAQHRIVNIPYIAYSNSPFNMEMLYTLALSLGSDILPHLIMSIISLLISLGMFLFCAKRFDHRTGLLAVAIWWNMQLVRVLSGTALVEIGLGFYAWLAFYALVEWVTKSGSEWLIVAGLMGGLTAGTKLTGAAIPVVLFLFLVSVLVWQRIERKKDVEPFRTVLLFGFVALAPVLPWYIKNYVHTRNPIWPFFNQVFDGNYWDAIGDTYHFAYLRITNMELSVGNLFLGPWYLTTDPGRFGGYDLGRFVLWLAPFAPLLIDKIRRKSVYLLSMLCVACYGIWFLLTHQTRFLMPIVPALCVLSATTGRKLMRKSKLSLVFQLMLVVMLIAGMPFWYPDQVKLWLSRLKYFDGSVSRTDFLRSHIDAFVAFEYCNRQLPTDSKILLFPYENRGYYLERPYVWGNLITQRYIRFEQFDNGQMLWRGLREIGITHVLDRPDFTHHDFAHGLELPFWEHVRGIMDELEKDYAILLFEKDGFFVYELKKR
jgi:hypothetical protein